MSAELGGGDRLNLTGPLPKRARDDHEALTDAGRDNAR